jgi:hypothetical protein
MRWLRYRISWTLVQVAVRLLPDEEERAQTYAEMVYEGLLPPHKDCDPPYFDAGLGTPR